MARSDETGFAWLNVGVQIRDLHILVIDPHYQPPRCSHLNSHCLTGGSCAPSNNDCGVGERIHLEDLDISDHQVVKTFIRA